MIIIAQENFNTIDPEESLLNLDEVIRHEPRGKAKVSKKRAYTDEKFEQREGKSTHIEQYYLTFHLNF